MAAEESLQCFTMNLRQLDTARDKLVRSDASEEGSHVCFCNDSVFQGG